MRIKLDEKHWINSDSYSCWIASETKNKKGNTTVRNVSGYYPTIAGAVENYIEKKIMSSEATKIIDLKKQLEELKSEVREWRCKIEN